MLFSEINDKYGAFYQYVTIRDAKEMGIIPKQYEEVFPDFCECGSENIIKKSLTQAMCCDPRCKVKLAYALSEMFSRFGVKGVGDETCKKMIYGIYDKLKYKSHLEVFLLEYADYPSSLIYTAAGENLAAACESVKRRTITFSKLASMIALPGFNTGIGNLLEGVNSFNQLCELIKKDGGIERYCTLRGAYAPEKIYNFYNSLTDMMIANHVFGMSLRREGFEHLIICITGRLHLNGEPVTKAEFVERCNNAARIENGGQLFEIENSAAINSCSYIVADYDSNSRKYRAGKARGVLITADDFYRKIMEETEKWKIAMKNRGEK